MFSGEIAFADTTFYLEDADKYLKHSGQVLSILYEDSDVVPKLEHGPHFEMEQTLPEANVTLIEPQFSNLKGPEYNKCHMQFIVDNGVWNEFEQQKAKVWYTISQSRNKEGYIYIIHEIMSITKHFKCLEIIFLNMWA